MAKNHEQEPRKLWRYMPLIGLVDLLQTGELRLPRADSFSDKKEGLVGLEAMLSTMPPELHGPAKLALAKQNRDCFVSCWHLSSSESLAMWKIYGVHNFSVAVVSNAGKVMRVCSDYFQDLTCTGMAGEVIYENYITDGTVNVQTVGLPFGYRELPVPSSIMTLFMKAKPFSYEQEWRVVMQKRNHDRPALRIAVGDLEKFIESIYVSPEAPDWMVQSIQTLVVKQFGLSKIGVTRSPLSKHFAV